MFLGSLQVVGKKTCRFSGRCFLVVFKLSGRRHVGFLAGHPIRKPKPLAKNEGKASTTRSLEENKSDSLSSKHVNEVASSYDDEFYSAQSDEFYSAHSQQDDEEVEGIVKAVLDNENNKQEDEITKTWRKEEKRSKRTLFTTRIIVLLSCAGIIVSSILFLVKGVSALEESVDDVQTGISYLQDAVDQGITTIDNYIASQTQAVTMTQELQSEFEGWCPKLRDEILALCNAPLEDLCDFSDIPFEEAIETVKDTINKTKSLVFDEVDDIRGDLVEISSILDTVDRVANNFSWAFWVSAGFVIALDLVVLAYMYGVIQAWREKLNACYRISRSLFIIPVLLFIMFMSWLFAILFLVGALVSADFCVKNPDVSLTDIFETYRDRFNSIVYELIIFFLDGCQWQSTIFAKFKEPLLRVRQFLQAIHNLLTVVADADEEIVQQICGVSATPIVAIAAALDEQVHIVYELLRSVVDIFSCSTFHPIYTIIAYDAVCYSGVDGLTWIFSTQLAMAVFSMVVATLRAACYEPEYYEVA